MHSHPAVGGILSLPACGIAAAASSSYRSLPAALSLAGKVTAGGWALATAMGLYRIATSVDREGCNDRIYRIR